MILWHERECLVDVTIHDPRENGIQRGGAIEGQSAGRFEIWRIDPKKASHEMRERFWNVSAIRAGQAGIYGLSHKGVLRRGMLMPTTIQHRNFRPIQTDRSMPSLV